MPNIKTLIYFVSAVIIFLYLLIFSFKKNTPLPWSFLAISIIVWFSGSVNLNMGFFYINSRVLVAFLILILYFPKDDFNPFNLAEKPLLLLITHVLLGLMFSYASFISNNNHVASRVCSFLCLLFIIFYSTSEEIIIRGLLLYDLQKYNISFLLVNLFQSVFFVSLHDMAYKSIPYLFIAFVFSFYAGYITMKKRSLVYPIVLHIIANMSYYWYF